MRHWTLQASRSKAVNDAETITASSSLNARACHLTLQASHSKAVSDEETITASSSLNARAQENAAGNIHCSFDVSSQMELVATLVLVNKSRHL